LHVHGVHPRCRACDAAAPSHPSRCDPPTTAASKRHGRAALHTEFLSIAPGVSATSQSERRPGIGVVVMMEAFGLTRS